MKRSVALLAAFLSFACSHNYEKESHQQQIAEQPAWQTKVLEGDHVGASALLEIEWSEVEDIDPNMLIWLGNLYIKASNYDAATLLASRLESLSSHKSDYRGIDKCIVARVLISKGDLSNAIDLAEECHKLSLVATGEIDRTHIATSSHLLGLAYHEAGRFEEALALYSISESSRLKSSWDFELGLSATLNNVANIYWKRGDLLDALDLHLRGLDLKRTILPPDHLDLAHSLNNIGAIQLDLGWFDQAFHPLEQALDIRKSQGGSLRSIAHSYHNLAFALYGIGNLEEATSYLKQALVIKEDILPKSHSDVLNSLLLQAKIQQDSGDIRASLSTTADATSRCDSFSGAICSKLLAHYLATIALKESSASLDLVLREYDALSGSSALRANDKIDASLAIASRMISARRFQAAKEILGSTFYEYWGIQLDKLSVGVRSLRSDLMDLRLSDALNTLASLQLASTGEGDPRETSRLSIFVIEKGLAGYYRLSSVKTANKHAETASSIGIAALAQLASDNQDPKFLEDLLLFADYANNWKLQSAFADIAALRRAGLTGEDLSEAKKQISRWLSEKGNWKDRNDLEQLTPLFSVFRPLYRVHASNRLRSVLHQSNATCLLYLEINEGIYLARFDEDGGALTRIGNVDVAQDLIQSLPTNYRIKSNEEYEHLHDLYQLLIGEAGKKIQTENIVVIRSPVIDGISFDSFVTQWDKGSSQSPEFLIQEHNISYSYSVGSLLTSFENQPLREYSKELLAIAPDFEKGEVISPALEHFLTSVSDSNIPIELLPLPGASLEVREIDHIIRSKFFPGLGGRKTTILKSDGNTESTVKALHPDSFRYLHFATHSFVNPIHPDSSGIVLSLHEKTDQDGVLYSNEILDINLSAELVVLSSCDSAVDNPSPRGRLSGFAASFIFAGAKNLVASVWPSDDVGTQILMQRFYNHIADGHSPDQALTRAKRDLINMGGPIANPYFWAGFIHIGAPKGMMKVAA